MSGHTPGPWYAWDNGDGLIGVGKNYGNQADLFRAKGESKRPKSEDDANMKLAAAAPDLLAELEEYSGHAREIIEALLSAGGRENLILADKINRRHPIRHKLIARAKGEK